MQGNPTKSFLLLTSLHHYAEAPTLGGFEANWNFIFTLLIRRLKYSEKEKKSFHVKISISRTNYLEDKQKSVIYTLTIGKLPLPLNFVKSAFVLNV